MPGLSGPFSRRRPSSPTLNGQYSTMDTAVPHRHPQRHHGCGHRDIKFGGGGEYGVFHVGIIANNSVSLPIRCSPAPAVARGTQAARCS